MAIFETHAHYFDNQFDYDRHEIVNKLKECSIDYIIEIADNINHSYSVIDFAKKNKNVYCAVGIHPENVDDMKENDLELLETFLQEAKNNKIVSIGEIGLDYHFKSDNKKLQQEVFRKQLDLAIKYNLPVVIHSRDACHDTLEIMQESVKKGTKGIMHCFAESYDIAKIYADMGIFLGVGGVVTFKNAKKLVEVVEKIPLDYIVVETDSPYLAPEPKRGTRNDSSNLVYVIQKIADIKKTTYNEVEEITYKNGKKIFGIE